jgi:hypothetical protein
MLTKYKLVDVSGASHVEYKGKSYPLDPDELTDEQADLLYGKTPHLVKLPEPAPVAESAELAEAAAPTEAPTEAPATAESAEPRPKRKRIGQA